MDLTRRDYSNSASQQFGFLDCDNDEETKVQNTKSQTEAALGKVGATFEILFGKKHPDVKYFILFCNLVNLLHAGPAAAATKSRFKSGVSSNWDKPLLQRRSINY
jgi:hypothetical protein